MKPKNLNRFCTIQLLAAACISSAVYAVDTPATKAGSVTDLTAAGAWTGGGGASGAPDSDDTATWTTGSLGGALSLTSAVSWGSINISDADADIAISGVGGSITTGNISLAGNKTLSIANNIALSGNSIYTIGNVNGTAVTDATLSGIISGASRGITKEGAGTLTLTAANTYTGATAINGGTLSLGTGGSLQTTSSITIAAGATLNLNAAGTGTRDALTAGALVINGTLSNTGQSESRLSQSSITMNNGTITCSLGSGDTSFGSFLVDGAPRTITANGGSNKINGVGYGIGLGNNLTFDTPLSTDALVVTARLGESLALNGGIAKNGLGTVTMPDFGLINYTGVTAVNAGTLVFTRTAAVASTTTALTIANGAAVTFTSTVAGVYQVLTKATTVGAGSQVTINDNTPAFVSGTNNSGIYLQGGLQTGGAGSVVTLNATNAGNAFVFRTANTNYTGKVIVNGIANSGVNLGSGIVLANATGSGAVFQNADIELNGTMELGNQGMAWASNGVAGTISIGALSGTGIVTSNGLNQTLSVGSNGASATFSGAIKNGTNTVSLTKTGSGTQTLSGTSNTYTGATFVNNGKLVINGSISTSTLTTVNSGGTLGGSGTVGALTVTTGGTLAPGNSPGILSAGNTDLQAGSILSLELNSGTVGGYDQLNVTGSVTLAGALNLAMGYTPANGTLFFILANDGLPVDTITGTFSNAATNGGTYTLGGQAFQISYFGNYTGGDTGSFTGGNDVVLMAVPEPAAAFLGSLGLLALLRRRRA